MNAKLLADIANTVTPLGVIFLLAVVIYNVTSGRNFTDFFKKSAVDEQGKPITLETLHTKINKIATNHLHGLPEMASSLERIEAGQSKANDILIEIKTVLTKK